MVSVGPCDDRIVPDSVRDVSTRELSTSPVEDSCRHLSKTDVAYDPVNDPPATIVERPSPIDSSDHLESSDTTAKSFFKKSVSLGSSKFTQSSLLKTGKIRNAVSQKSEYSKIVAPFACDTQYSLSKFLPSVISDANHRLYRVDIVDDFHLPEVRILFSILFMTNIFPLLVH